MKASSSLALLSLLCSCRPHHGAGGDGSPIQLLVRQAVPPNATALSCESPIKRTYSTTLTCQATVASDEQSYRDWIRKAFSQRFRFRQTVDNHLWLTRYEAGETQRFDIAVEPGAGSQCSVRIVLFVDAD
jgi:hypothetical protein